MGIGGGFMMTIYMNKTAYSLTARESAPAAANRDMFTQNANLSRTGGLAVGVPGELVGYWEVWKKLGTLPWKDLIQPSIDLCQKGYTMSTAQYNSIFFRPGVFDKDNIFREMFYNYDQGEYFKPGSIIKPKKICETYAIIAREGGMALNNGSLTKGFVDDVRIQGGILTENDMRLYRVEWSEPVKFTLNGGHIVYSAPPPASGVLLAYILQILDGFNLTAPYANVSEASEPHIIEKYVTTLHRIVESYKFAFAQRSRLGDPHFVDVEQVKKDLLSKENAENARKKIIDNRTYTDGSYYGSVSFTQDDHGTAHLSILSSEGDAVSVTSTINLYFGAGFISESTGIFPNSVMDDFSSPGAENFFSLKPSENHFIAGGKRPLSSACPTIVTNSDGQVSLVIGASGGTKIPTAVSWVMLRHIWFNENIKDAVDASRIHHQLSPMKLEYEYGLTVPLVEGLQKLGHTLERYRYRGSIICAITKFNGTIYANADFRKGGEVYGF